MCKKEEERGDLESKGLWRIYKNVLVISLAFMLHFIGYCGAANLQSSINAEAGLGTASLASVYAALIFSNIFLPVAVIKWLGTKWTICLSFLVYMPYIGAQLWPTFYTLIPAGLMVGVGGGPLFCAKCTYLSVISEAHSRMSKIPAHMLLVRFLGLFFMIYVTNQVWSNLISSLVISSGDNEAAMTAVNASIIPELCGGNFLPSEDSAVALRQQPPEKIQMLTGIYLVCIAAAILLVAIGVDSMTRYNSDRPKSGHGLSGLELLVVTIKLMQEPNLLMLITISIFVGMEQAFFGADFTAAYVSCAVGTGTLGLVMMTFGVFNAAGCIITGYLTKITSRMFMICVATLLHGSLFVTLLVWKSQADVTFVLYIAAAIWGLCDSIWIVQINGYFGVLFKGREEAAFSNFRLWESVGYILAYIISPHFRTSTKTYVLFVLMIIGVVLYITVEYREQRTRKRVEKKNSESCYIKDGCDNNAFQHVEL